MSDQKRQYCGTLNEKEINKTVSLCGWIDTIRNHGSLLFIHIRDRSGIIQLVFDESKDKQIYQLANTLRNEFVIKIKGDVRQRSEENKNHHLPTGLIEIEVKQLTVLNKAKTPPFLITEKSMYNNEKNEPEINVDEDLRLQYRFLDLRRPSMQKKLIARHKIIKIIRDYCSDHDFLELETPMLTKSTPEGARDFLVPSRTHPHSFYALPQSPQLFKQLLMVSGFDKYFQIVKCFRDEDLRPNRQPEFTQLDMEASFIDESFIYKTIEALLQKLYKSQNKELPTPFPKITYQEAMEKYGNDRPDLRFDLQLTNLTEDLKNTSYKIFNTIAKNGGVILGLNLKNQADKCSKSMLQEELAKKVIPKFGGKGLTWMKVEKDSLQSNVVQFFSAQEQTTLKEKLKASDNDILILLADTNPKLIYDIASRFRLYMGDRLNLIDKKKICPCWITDFPLFEKSDGKYTAIHHPFTQPQKDILKENHDEETLLKLKAKAYDVVINGEEIGGGSIRIHDAETQKKIFEILNLNKEEIQEKFGFFVNALQYGTPPHGGIALGVDRLVSMLLDEKSIREIIPFPKNRAALCPLTQAPDKVKDTQLNELYLNLKDTPNKEPS